MTKITIQLQDMEKIMLDGGSVALSPNWNMPRKTVHTYETEKEGESAAEEAFHITNAPQECLNEKERSKVKGYKGHSLSVGDIIIVTTDGKTQKFLCDMRGWKQKDVSKEIKKPEISPIEM